MYYYLKANLRGCHAGDAVKTAGKVGAFIRVVMKNEVINVPQRIFPIFFSKEPVTPDTYGHIKFEDHPVVVCKRTSTSYEWR